MGVPFGDLATTRTRYINTLSESDRAKFESLPSQQQEKVLVDFAAANTPVVSRNGGVSIELSGTGNAMSDCNSGLVLSRESSSMPVDSQGENDNPPIATHDTTSSVPPSGTTPPAEATEKELQWLHQYEQKIEKGELSTPIDYQREIDMITMGEYAFTEDARLALELLQAKLDEFKTTNPSQYRLAVDSSRREDDRLARVARRAVVDEMHQEAEEACMDFNQQLREQSMAAELWDATKSFFGNDNTMDKVGDDVRKKLGEVSRLYQRAGNISQEEFNKEFKRITGNDYDEKLALRFARLEKEYKAVLQAKSAVDNYSALLNMEYSPENTSTLESQLGGEEVLGTLISNYNSLSNEEKFNCLKQLAEQGKQVSQKEYEQTLKESRWYTFERLSCAYKNTRGELLEMIGCDNIKNRVDEYCKGQEEGAGYVRGGAKFVAATAIIVATGGAGGLAAASLITAGTSAAVEIGDRATSGRRGDLSQGELLKIARDAAIDGAMVFAGGKLTSTVARTGMSTLAKIGTISVGEGVMGAAGDYIKTGEVTVEGVAFNMVLGGLGAAVELRGMYSPIGDKKANGQTLSDLKGDPNPPKLRVLDKTDDIDALEILYGTRDLERIERFCGDDFGIIEMPDGKNVLVERGIVRGTVEDTGAEWYDFAGHFYDKNGNPMPDAAKVNLSAAKKYSFKGEALTHKEYNGWVNKRGVRELSELLTQYPDPEDAISVYIKQRYSHIKMTPELEELAKAEARYTLNLINTVDTELASIRPNLMPERYFRGIHGDNTGTRILSSAKVGDIIMPDSGYSFASTKLYYGNEDYARNGFLLEIRMPPGARVAHDSGLWYQVILPRNIQYRVVSMEEAVGKEIPVKYTKVVLEALGQIDDAT